MISCYLVALTSCNTFDASYDMLLIAEGLHPLIVYSDRATDTLFKHAHAQCCTRETLSVEKRISSASPSPARPR